MHEADDAYSIQSTWSRYWLDQFFTLPLNTLTVVIAIPSFTQREMAMKQVHVYQV